MSGFSVDRPLPEVAPLFEPLSLGALHLKNRIVMAPMTRAFSPGGVPGADVCAYYRRRAEGGVGLIITEGSWVNHAGASNDPNVPRFYGGDALAGWAEICREVHEAGARIMPQLWHIGGAAKSEVAEIYSEHAQREEESDRVSPSGLSRGGVAGGRAMTQADIEAVHEAYVDAACHAQRIGFDGVELHGAHGYLLDQFFWHETNTRGDSYGGSAAARGQFVADMVRGIKARTGAAFPVILRISQWKIQDYAAQNWPSPEELAAFLSPLAAAGIDAFHCSQRRYWEPAFAGSPCNLAGWVKRLTGRPVITVGSITLSTEFIATLMQGQTAAPVGLHDLVERLRSKEFDLVAVGRALITNPDWPHLIASGQIETLRPFAAAALATLA